MAPLEGFLVNPGAPPVDVLMSRRIDSKHELFCASNSLKDEGGPSGQWFMKQMFYSGRYPRENVFRSGLEDIRFKLELYRLVCVSL